ncbi:MAG: membrane protein insertase YidC [Burkholderiales bacterium]|nr:membrane protein insertase YidC [Burkholderiales bacterium]
MTDMRRTLLWVIFIMSLVLLYDSWNKQHGHPSMFGGAVPAATSSAAPPATQAAVPGATGGTPGSANTIVTAGGTATGTAAGASAGTAPADQQVTITTDVVKATFDSRGGTLVRLQLLGYRESADAREDVVLFDDTPQHHYVAQTGLVTTQPGVALPNHLTPMVIDPGPRTLAPGETSLTLRFQSQPVDGRQLIKTYTFRRGAYTIDVKNEFVNGGSTPVSPQLYLQLARDGKPADAGSHFYSTFTGPAMYTEAGHYQKIPFKDVATESHEKSADNGWVAMVQHYFASAWLLPTPLPREFRTAQTGPDEYTIAMVVPMGVVAPGARKSIDATLFAGPQKEDMLAALAPGLERVKDYGWLYVLAKPLFWLLTRLHGLLGNWGWAIVALVVCLKAAFFWLNASAYRSMAKMKAVAPKVAELKERYKDKPQEMQQQMMRIYREEKVNPLGGCLPIFVQMPFFISLYWVLLSSVEMRGAPWIGWIHDLSIADPYFILPVLMMASSIAQVALNPKPPDPVQAKMMWIMPVAFGFMFFFFPAGLVLYWLTNNLLSIAQQWVINKRMGVVGK